MTKYRTEKLYYKDLFYFSGTGARTISKKLPNLCILEARVIAKTNITASSIAGTVKDSMKIQIGQGAGEIVDGAYGDAVQQVDLLAPGKSDGLYVDPTLVSATDAVGIFGMKGPMDLRAPKNRGSQLTISFDSSQTGSTTISAAVWYVSLELTVLRLPGHIYGGCKRLARKNYATSTEHEFLLQPNMAHEMVLCVTGTDVLTQMVVNGPGFSKTELDKTRMQQDYKLYKKSTTANTTKHLMKTPIGQGDGKQGRVSVSSTATLVVWEMGGI